MRRFSKTQILGWAAVAVSTLIASIWAFWGIIETFHEGWFHDSLLKNLGLMFLQYLGPMMIFVFLTLLAIAYPRAGGPLHALIGLALGLFLFGWDDFAPMVLIIIPLVLLGLLYWFGRPEPRRWAYRIAVGLPLLTLIVCGIEPVWRISGRVDDGNRGARLVEGNGVMLIWAPEGNGWPREGVTWEQAVGRCRNLAADGTTLAETPQDIWRLPTVEEAVRSMSRHGENSGGDWDARSRIASYRVRPDKETPLWNPRSQVIYWWTATEIDAERAFIIVYDGKVWPRTKRFAPGYLAYRCVRTP